MWWLSALEAAFAPEALTMRAAALLVALALDAVFGDPPTRVHPVAWLGAVIAAVERLVRTLPGLGPRAAGGVLAGVVVAVATGLAFALSRAAYEFGPAVGVLADATLIWLALAARSLAAEGTAVARHLSAGDLHAARSRVARVVARRTDVLDESGVARASIESLGENVVDGVIAPLMWAAVAGPAGAWMHKAASTLDSMVGYRTEPYARFGSASATLDDALAWVPARLALVIVPLAALLSGLDAPGAWRVGLRDRRNHASPNAAHGEATFAGALGVRLGGPAEYADLRVERPLIGEDLRAPGAADTARAAKLVMTTTLVTTVLLAAALLAATYPGR